MKLQTPCKRGDHWDGTPALPRLWLRDVAPPDGPRDLDFPILIVLPHQPANLAAPRPSESSNSEDSCGGLRKQCKDLPDFLKTVGIGFLRWSHNKPRCSQAGDPHDLQRIIREGRSKGVVVFFASQSPNDYQQKFFNFQELLEFAYIFQCDGVAAGSVQDIIGCSAKTAKELQTEIARMEPWQVIARSQEKTEEFVKFTAEAFYKSYS